MAESPKKQELDDLLSGPLERGSYDKLVKGIHSSFKAVDRATDYVKELRAGLDGASDSGQRDQWEKVGILSFVLGHYEEVIAALERVKTRKDAAHFLGRAYLELNRTQEALAALDAGRQGEDDFATDMLVVDALCRERDAEAARKICERYRNSSAENPDWLYGMGRVLETEGEYEEAMAHYEQALERNAEHRGSLFRLALNCDLNGEDERALKLYERCASLNPTFVGALTNLGVLCEDKGDYGRAIECYKRVLAIDPSHGRAQMYLKGAEASLGMRIEDERTRGLGPGDEILLIPLSNFELSARSRSVLEKLNVKTLGDLCRLSENDLLQFKNFGETSLDEVKNILARYNLTLAGFPSSGGSGMPQLGAPVDDEDLREKLNTPIELLGLATRSSRCVEKLNITTVGELVAHTEEELLAVPNFGRTSVAEIKNTLAALGLSLRENENA